MKMHLDSAVLAIPGETFGSMTAEYLHRTDSKVRMASCWPFAKCAYGQHDESDGAEMTDSPVSTYFELTHATGYNLDLDVPPLQVENRNGNGNPILPGYTGRVWFPFLFYRDAKKSLPGPIRATSRMRNESRNELDCVGSKGKPWMTLSIFGTAESGLILASMR